MKQVFIEAPKQCSSDNLDECSHQVRVKDQGQVDVGSVEV